MTNVPACKDCCYFSGVGSVPECHHPDTQTFDIVGGMQSAPCRAARSGACGLRGTLFKQRDYIPEWVVRWCLLGGVALTVLWSFLKATGW